jgi:Mg-chelatase subunit ChlD
MKRLVVAFTCLCFLSLSFWRKPAGRRAAHCCDADAGSGFSNAADNDASAGFERRHQRQNSNRNDYRRRAGSGRRNYPHRNQSGDFSVSVLDRDGRFITGLQKGDFQIFENGVEQKIEEFATVQQPFTVILLIDVSPSTAFKIDEIHDAAISFVDQLRAEDKVMVIAFDERVRVLSQVTNNRTALRNAIRRAEFGDGTSLYEAVDHVINRELQRIEGRKAVVLFTDGVDTTSRRANYQSTVASPKKPKLCFTRFAMIPPRK